MNLCLACSLLLLGLPQQKGTGLRQLASKIRLNLGCAVQPTMLRDNADSGEYAKAIENNVNMVEPENDLKPPAIWRGPNDYNFANADFLLGAPGQKGWAQAHKMKVRGHVLLYARDDGYTIPRWLLAEEKQLTEDQAREMLHDYIRAVAGRYKGKIAFWDVANEAIDDRENGRPFNLRDSFWFRKLGPDFLVDAFKFAHEADPKAELYYNEYAVEAGGRKADDMLALVAHLREKGAPITGVGLQYHIYPGYPVRPDKGNKQLLDRIKSMGLAFMVTELDMGIQVVAYPRTDPRFGIEPKDPADLDKQAEQYATVFKLALSYRNCHGIQIWGITDRHSWIPGFLRGRGAALLLGGDYKPKPAYRAVEDVLLATARGESGTG